MRRLALALLVSLSAFASSAGQQTQIALAPSVMARRLYKRVVVRAPIGITTSGERLQNLAPYMSRRLLGQIRTTRLCENDWYAHNRDPSIKPPFAWLELGLFTGPDDYASISAFHIERQDRRKDGSTDVYVRLRSQPIVYSSDLPKEPPEKAYYWNVTVRVVTERGKPVVDDVVYLKRDAADTEYRLSEILGSGCRGSLWIGGLE